MIVSEDFCPIQTEERFRTLFRELLDSDQESRKWTNVDIVYSSSEQSQNFSDVAFLMASDEKSSYLYSACKNGNSVYSITQNEGLTIRTGPSKRTPRLRLR